MTKRLINMLILFLICVSMMVVYTLVHEGAHALFIVIFGGRVTDFDFNMLSGNPHVGFDGDIGASGYAVMRAAGPLLPYLLLMAGLFIMNRNRRLFAQKVYLFTSFMVLASMIPNIIIPVLLETGADVSGEDIAAFTAGMGFNGYAVAFVMVLLFAAALILILKKLRIKDAFTYMIDADLRNKKLLAPMVALIVILVGIPAVAAFNIIGQNIGNRTANVPKNYDHHIDLVLENIDEAESTVFDFIAEKPELYDFNIIGDTTAEVVLKITGTTRISGLRANEMVICSGKGKTNSIFTNWLLEKGHYSVTLAKTDGSGRLGVYISSRDSKSINADLRNKDEDVLNGIIPDQEQGYKLAAKEQLADCVNKNIYEFNLSKSKNVSFSIYLTTKTGEATVKLVGDGREEELISGYQIQTQGRGAYLVKGKYNIVLSSSGCDGEIYLFTAE